ncbi:DsbA family protein [Erythrobacter sp. F6033]|uniref:DsbA family protein n=1 Tax=Erythrobacter sp. F6033 TaxID=2926401 RepID=UPI001FF38389|nr:DsbA family protein [Erythrobacter sp. F6033]MCK0129673.1 DsbA family protein [Erythrobacter sp. F6033]
MRTSLLTALLALVFGFLGAGVWSLAGLADNRTRGYLVENPEILEEMAMALQDNQARERLAKAGDEIYEAFPGAVMGNPDGSRVLVEFTDYNCPYCEASLADVNRLISEDPDLKVVMREWPIFEGSDAAARMALAAGLQGKYAAFHETMFKLGPTTPEAIEAAAIEVGLDLDRARNDAASDAVSVELAKNLSFARSLGFSGTPAWIAGDNAMGGMVGYEALKEALDEIES